MRRRENILYAPTHSQSFPIYRELLARDQAKARRAKTRRRIVLLTALILAPFCAAQPADTQQTPPIAKDQFQ
ncbi:hypothetical protein SAMN04488005_1533 [Yoonia tamlensis]|uniref:Uncharacterized protein n=1 Tax=Yoonia tamlensis TaxID=390270 RepID=A0A1I6GEL0_9RHOB|nr:hypothetical protein [Yoonia tamlensis]SFR40643.1 hypothetical protein SAMN04488005_1533 [Yoonia tamlensis]